jgi:hypothetical protein
MRTRAKKKHVASDRARRENVPWHILSYCKNMSVYADQNHAPSLTDVRLEITGNSVGSS